MKGAYNWREVPMPERIAKRPRTPEGYPVPYVNFVDETHGPDLRVLDQKRVAICVQRQLCGICGEPLGRMKVFIGGEASVTSRAFADPAMHEECAVYASKACPYMAMQNYHHALNKNIERKKSANVMLIENPLSPGEGSKRPDRMALYYCRSFKFEVMKDAQGQKAQVIKASEPLALVWF